MKLNVEELNGIMKFAKWRVQSWEEYIKYVDPHKQLDVKTKELIRNAFHSGCTSTITSFYTDQEGEEKKNDIIDDIGLIPKED